FRSVRPRTQSGRTHPQRTVHVLSGCAHDGCRRRQRQWIRIMGDNSPRLLTVAVTSRALFDLEEGHALFEREGVEAYAAYQREHEDDILKPGVAFPVVRKLLALNDGAPVETPRVEVILLSRNSADTGLRIFNSIQHYGLGIVRATFTAGE